MIRSCFLNSLLVVLVALIILPGEAIGQVPGYMGKKFLFSYDAKMSPNLYRYFQSPENGNPLINYMHNLDAEYVISQGGAIGLSLKYARNRFDLQNDYPRHYDSPDDPPLDEDETIAGIVDYKAIAFSYKAFMRSNGVMAPLGSYFKAEIALGRMGYRPKFSRYADAPAFSNAYWVPSLNIGFGKHFILWDKMLLDMAMEITTPYNFTGVFVNTTPLLQLNRHKNAESAHKRMYRQLFFNFRVGVGFVGF